MQSEEESSSNSSLSDDSSSTESSLSLSGSEESDFAMDSLLPESFRDKSPKMEFSKWTLSNLRKFLLGQPIPKDERTALTEKYYVSAEVFELFQSVKLSASPLSLLKFQNSNAGRDVGFIHSEVNFSLRLLMHLYEQYLVMVGKFSGERKSMKKKVSSGIYHDLHFSYDASNPFLIPNPRESMEKVSERQINRFKNKFDFTDPNVTNDIARWAIGYKDAFLELASLVGPLLQFGENADTALDDIRGFLAKTKDHLGDATRLVGSSSQFLKSFREKEYISRTDNSFADFIKLKKAGKSKEQLQEERLEVLDEQKFIKNAKEYSKIKKALATVTREKVTARAKKVKESVAVKPKEDKQKPVPNANKGKKFKKKFKAKKPKEVEKDDA